MNKKRIKPIAVLFICFIAYCSLYVSRSTITVFATALNDDGILSVSQYGIVGSLFFVIYAVGRLFNGFLSDLFDSRLLISAGVFLAGFSNVIIGIFRSAPVIFVFWCLNAVGQSMVWSAILVASVNKVESEKKDIYMSILGSSVAFGTVLGIVISSRSFAFAGLMSGFLFPGLLGILMSLISFVLLPPTRKKDRQVEQKTVISLLKAIRQDTFILFVPIMVNGVLKDGISLWFISYVMNSFGIDVSSIAGYVFFVPLLGFIGRILFPWFYRLLGKNELRTAMVDYLVAAVFILPLCFKMQSLILIIISFCVMFAFVSMANLAFVGMFPINYSDSNRVGLVSGSVDLLIYMGSGISSAIFGFIVSAYGFGLMFDIWLVLLLLSVIILCFFGTKKKQVAFVEG